MLKGIKRKGIIYQKVSSRYITSSSMERSFMTNPLTSIWNNMKKKLTTG